MKRERIRKYNKNIELVQQLTYKQNHIDLIFCIDMLNMGYHVDDVNGVIMFRATHSDIIYMQQIGRCLSINSKIEPVIFDLVGNYKNKAHGYSLVINNSTKNSANSAMNIGLEQVKIIDSVTNVSKIARLINMAVNAGPTFELVLEGYEKNAPTSWVMKQLKLKTLEELNILLDISGISIRPSDKV